MTIYRYILGIFIPLYFSSFNPTFALEADYCDGCGGKCATHYIFSPEYKEELQRSIFLDDDDIPKVGQKSYISPQKIFKIYYDTVGYNAPPILDKNQNGVPDYVDSVAYYFDYVYDVYVNDFGFRSPYPDRGSRGSDHYDVYLYDLGDSDSDFNQQPYSAGGIYGATYFTNKDIINDKPFLSLYSYIIIDNDFSEKDSIRIKGNKAFPAYRFPGIPSLKVTVAHEFFHAVQFMYGISEPGSNTIMEMNAVAMERVLFPEVNDYIQYVKSLFQNPSTKPFGIDDPNIGYAHSIFNQYLLEKFDIGIIVLSWEKVAEGHEVYSALDLALKQYGSSMQQAWCEFLDWIYYTGTRAIEGNYFSNAKELPMVVPFSFVNFESPSKSVSGFTSPLEFRFLNFIFPASGDISDDTLNILLGNTDINSASKQFNISKDYFFRVSDSQTPDSKKIENINYWLYQEIDTNFYCVHNISNSGGSTYKINFAYPNPFRSSVDEYLLFPAPANAELYQKALLNIYSSDMNHIYSKSIQVTVNNGNRVLMWNDIPNEISSGVYIYGIKLNDEMILGKFSIIKD
jgi:hypothetical protein